MNLARKIAARGVDVYVWDFSANDNNNTLFKTLTNGKPGHILKGLNRTYKEIYSFATRKILPKFRSFACGVPNNKTTPAPTSTSQTNHTSPSPAPCCSCCSCQNSNPPIPIRTTPTRTKNYQDRNPPEQCGGFIFTTAISIQRCNAFIKFVKLSANIVSHDLPNTGNGFALRAIGKYYNRSKKLRYFNKGGFKARATNWINTYTNNCVHPMAAHYSQ